MPYYKVWWSNGNKQGAGMKVNIAEFHLTLVPENEEEAGRINNFYWEMAHGENRLHLKANEWDGEVVNNIDVHFVTELVAE